MSDKIKQLPSNAAISDLQCEVPSLLNDLERNPLSWTYEELQSLDAKIKRVAQEAQRIDSKTLKETTATMRARYRSLSDAFFMSHKDKFTNLLKQANQVIDNSVADVKGILHASDELRKVMRILSNNGRFIDGEQRMAYYDVTMRVSKAFCKGVITRLKLYRDDLGTVTGEDLNQLRLMLDYIQLWQPDWKSLSKCVQVKEEVRSKYEDMLEEANITQRYKMSAEGGVPNITVREPVHSLRKVNTFPVYGHTRCPRCEYASPVFDKKRCPNCRQLQLPLRPKGSIQNLGETAFPPYRGPKTFEKVITRAPVREEQRPAQLPKRFRQSSAQSVPSALARFQHTPGKS